MTAAIWEDDILDDDGQIEPARRGRKPKVNHLVPYSQPEPRGAGLPDRSWWLGKSGADFQRAADAEQERMQKSKFGKLAGNIPESKL
jgi:hypothetical protein